ncbi:MAG: hypothetical protein JW723_15705 [Bacteroidales bacterium]|nr:hypothetical protein [Bacteroidales bacterium]
MLFAARRNEVGNVHRRDGVSKTVTKIMWVGLFKNPKPKERPNPPAGEAGESPFRCSTITADTAERSFPDLILKGISGFLSVFFPRFTTLNLKQAFRTARMKKISGLQPDDLKNHSFRLKYQPSCSEGKPERLKEKSIPAADNVPLTLQHTDAFIKLTAFAIGLTSPSIPTPDEGVKTPSEADVRTTCFDVRLLAVPGLTLDASVRVLATKGRHVDADDGLMQKTFKQLITNEYC